MYCGFVAFLVVTSVILGSLIWLLGPAFELWRIIMYEQRCASYKLWVYAQIPSLHSRRQEANTLFQIHVRPFLLYFLPPPTTQRRRCYFQTEIRIHLPPSCH